MDIHRPRALSALASGLILLASLGPAGCSNEPSPPPAVKKSKADMKRQLLDAGEETKGRGRPGPGRPAR